MGKKRSKRYVASKVPVSTPLAVRLTQPSAWRSDGGINGPFEVVRFHFIIEDEPLAEFGWGKATTSMVSADGTAMTAREKMVVHYEEVNSSTLVEDHLQSTDLLAKLGADASIGSEHFGTAAFTAAVETHFTETFQNTRTVTSATTRSYTHEVEVEVSTPGGTERTVRAVPYQRRRMSIWLHHVDYLTVVYKPTLKGLRWRRVKTPAPGVDHDSHRNWAGSGIKLGSYQYWESQGSALTNQIGAAEHAKSQINPLDVTFTPATTAKKRFYGLGMFRARPSLYKVSNAAFPLKDSQRREGWTEEQLLQLSDWATPETSWVWERSRKSRRTWGLAGPET